MADLFLQPQRISIEADSRAAVEYWATGLEPVYYEGAFRRAVSLPG